MIPFRQILRICEGNKKLARTTQTYIKNQQSISLREWKNTIRPVMLQAEKDILETINSIDATQWQIFSLTNILNQVQEIINRFDGQFKAQQPNANRELVNLANNYIDRNMDYIGIDISLMPKITDDVLKTLIPLADVYISGFTGDMAKIIKAEISTGIISGSSVGDVARKIKEKFASSDMSYARAERIAQTEMLRSASLTQQLRAEQVKANNPKLKKSWISMHKPNARQTHIAVETATKETPIPVDEQFYVDGEYAMYPRDPSLSARNTVNCACTLVYTNEA